MQPSERVTDTTSEKKINISSKDKTARMKLYMEVVFDVILKLISKKVT